MVMEEHMLSTVDNPYNPFHQFDEWHAWDIAMGYNTTGYLARIVHLSYDLSSGDEDVAIENAISEIIEENVFGVHIRVTENSVTPRPPFVDGSTASIT